MATRLQSALGLVLLGLAALPAAAITLGQTDTFEDLSTAGWASGTANPVQPTVVASGGPAGDGDAYLFIASSGGSGPGSRLVGVNAGQWTGDYAAAGVTGLAMDVANFGSSALHLRLYFSGNGFVTDGVALPAGSGWTRVRFGFDPGALAGFFDLRIFHGDSLAPAYPGPALAAQLGIDNITAVPEPGTWASLGLGVLAVLRRLHALRSTP